MVWKLLYSLSVSSSEGTLIFPNSFKYKNNNEALNSSVGTHISLSTIYLKFSDGLNSKVEFLAGSLCFIHIKCRPKSVRFWT